MKLLTLINTFLLIILPISGCGGITLDSGGITANDPIPTGKIVSQGQFFGQGQSISGTATVYLVSTGNYILRLGALSVPAQNGLTVQLSSSSSIVASFTLRNTAGNQNYSFTSGVVNFTTTNILSSSGNNAVIASALMAAI